MSSLPTEPDWTLRIRPATGWFDIHLGELWRYRDLIMLFVWRDFVAVYKQTVLGPIWYLIQPILTTLVFTVIFGRVAGIPTDGVPPFLFYLSGIVCWRYFADCLTKTSNTFVGNAGIFGKVYFPRLTVPIAIVLSNLITLAVQLALLAAVWIYYRMDGSAVAIGPAVLLLPLLILQMGLLGLGCGIIVSALTTKYRDLTQLVAFGVQLWMYATPVVYPASVLSRKWDWLILSNPMAPIVEGFRRATLGVGTIDARTTTASWAITLALLAIGIVLFSRIEKDFMDVV